DTAAEDSVSSLPLFSGTDEVREAIVHHSIDGSFSIRQGRWKLELCPGSGGWSYPKPGEEPAGSPPIQLYDMQADVGEQVNVYDDHPETVERLKGLLTKYVREGRSTPGAPQPNTGPRYWPQLNWLSESEV
ncbi:MAG: arylsulfatase, partial [Spirochaetota bacterium]